MTTKERSVSAKHLPASTGGARVSSKSLPAPKAVPARTVAAGPSAKPVPSEAAKQLSKNIPMVHISHSALADLPLLLMVFLSIAFVVWLSVAFPATVFVIPVRVLLLGSFSLSVPLFGIIPIAILLIIARNLFDAQYTLASDRIQR